MAKKDIKRVEKPWGYELIWAGTKDYVGKVLHIKKGHKLSERDLRLSRKNLKSLGLFSGIDMIVNETKTDNLKVGIIVKEIGVKAPAGNLLSAEGRVVEEIEVKFSASTIGIPVHAATVARLRPKLKRTRIFGPHRLRWWRWRWWWWCIGNTGAT